MGATRQEKWLLNNIKRLDVKVAIGVGGLFDFYSGSISRAPIWVRELSLEWAWRLAVQPLDKGRRYLINAPLFMVRAAKSALLQNKQNLKPNLV
jgi:N-acetylglucosaminyldiphosphoundecaprenol N-acetyl-beta-D-mannosaminyltransferase